MVKASAYNVGELDLIPGSGRSPGEGNGNPLLPGKSHGWRSLVGYSPWGRKELDTTEGLHSLVLSILGYVARVCSVMSDSLQPHGLWSVRLLCPWNFPGSVYPESKKSIMYIFPGMNFLVGQLTATGI